MQTPLVSSIKYTTYEGTAQVDKTLSYAYDSLGNITSVKEDGVVKQQFYYDSLNRLTRENNVYADRTYIYTYDNAGNILSKMTYPYAASTSNPVNAVDSVIYTYGDASWGDLLTAYDGISITYDEIGNPLNWRNATSLTWEGRELSSMQLDAASSVTFTYNSDGIRTQKRYRNNSNGTLNTRTATLDGNKIISERIYDSASGISTTLYYLYDEKGDVAGLIYNNQYYYFQKNVQGDVIRLVNASGVVVVEYTYDAWGNILSMTGTLADTVGTLNPFRYRSYYYDSETGLYYLQSRYYDPEVGRFLNADGYVSTGQDISSCNMFAYCGNNPVNRADYTGESWGEIWEFAKTAVAEIEKAMGTMAPAYAGCGGVAIGDGPLLFGDVVAAAGVAVLTVGAIGIGIYQATQEHEKSVPTVEEKSKPKVIPKKLNNSVTFPNNPHAFKPFGLVKVERAGTKNGKLISWMDPFTNTEVFRWDENPNYSNGPHYHIYGKGHYEPGNSVPEPYARIYFPFGGFW